MAGDSSQGQESVAAVNRQNSVWQRAAWEQVNCRTEIAYSDPGSPSVRDDSKYAASKI